MSLKDSYQKIIQFQKELAECQSILDNSKNRGEIQRAKILRAKNLKGIKYLSHKINKALNPFKLLATFENPTDHGVVILRKVFHNLTEEDIYSTVDFMKFVGTAPKGLKIKSIMVLDTKDDWSIL